MCYYSSFTKNRKYTATQKNKGNIPLVSDPRTLYVPIACGNCKECRKAKAREWAARLHEDIKKHTNGQFVTLTLSDQSYTELYNIVQQEINTLQIRIELFDTPEDNTRYEKISTPYGIDNQIATLATRRFLERWRKKYKKSVRHWLITELGHKGTKNIHMHGIIFTDHWQDIKKIWQYGFVWDGYNKAGKRINYVNGQTISYSTKYCHKIDHEHKLYRPIVLCSAGIGNNYTTTGNAKFNKFKDLDTKESYTTQSGHEMALPIYWRNKIYTEEQREQLWLQKLDKQIRYVNGQKFDISKNDKLYWRAIEDAQRQNKELGYGNNEKNWKRKKYEDETRKIMQDTRIKRALKNKAS